MEPQARQGDVYLTLVNVIPSGAKKVKLDKNGRIILAAGETHGHYHAIDFEDGVIEGYEKDGVLYLSIKDSREVVHETHGSIPLGNGLLPNGIYETTIAIEYDPLGSRNVLD